LIFCCIHFSAKLFAEEEEEEGSEEEEESKEEKEIAGLV
jgi:hypothetical protein